MKYKLLILLTMTLLSACWFYIPSSSERTAKEMTLKEVESFLKELELEVIPNIPMQYPSSNFHFFYGNYIKKESNTMKTYRSNMSGVEICKIFLEYLKNKSELNTKPAREQCDIIKVHEDYFFSRIAARKEYSGFWLAIEIKESTTSFYLHNPNNIMKWKTTIEIYIHSSVDKYNSSNKYNSLGCNNEIPEEDDLPCANAAWHEEREK